MREVINDVEEKISRAREPQIMFEIRGRKLLEVDKTIVIGDGVKE